MCSRPLSPTSVQPLVFALPAPDISTWRAGNTGTEGVWHFDSGRPGRRVMVSALVHGNETIADLAARLGFSETSAFRRAFRRLKPPVQGRYCEELLPSVVV